MARSGPAESSSPPEAARATLLRSISEGVRTIVTVTERLSDLRTETAALRSDLLRLGEIVYRIAGDSTESSNDLARSTSASIYR